MHCNGPSTGWEGAGCVERVSLMCMCHEVIQKLFVNLSCPCVSHTQVCTYDRMGLGFSKRLMQNETTGTEKVWGMSTTGRWVCYFNWQLSWFPLTHRIFQSVCTESACIGSFIIMNCPMTVWVGCFTYAGPSVLFICCCGIFKRNLWKS